MQKPSIVDKSRSLGGQIPRGQCPRALYIKSNGVFCCRGAARVSALPFSLPTIKKSASKEADLQTSTHRVGELEVAVVLHFLLLNLTHCGTHRLQHTFADQHSRFLSIDDRFLHDHDVATIACSR